jgi:hypothetical protein
MTVEKIVQSQYLTEPEARDPTKSGQVTIATPFAPPRLQQSLPDLKSNTLKAF